MLGMDLTKSCQLGRKWGEKNANNRTGNCSQLTVRPVKLEYRSKLSSSASEQSIVERLLVG